MSNDDRCSVVGILSAIVWNGPRKYKWYL